MKKNCDYCNLKEGDLNGHIKLFEQKIRLKKRGRPYKIVTVCCISHAEKLAGEITTIEKVIYY